MTNYNSNLPTINRIKQRAKQLKKEQGISNTAALEQLSQNYNFPNWKLFKEELTKNEQAKAPIPPPSVIFVEYDDVEMTDDDYEVLDQEREAELTEDIKKRVANNKRQLTKLGVEFSVFEPTMTGLRKAILDATQQIRVHFELEDFHYYWEQGQGPEYKVMKDAYLLSDDGVIKSKASLYRPKTKQGDPRIWFRKLPSFSSPDDQVAIIIKDGATYLINLSTVVIEKSLDDNDSQIRNFLLSFVTEHNIIAEELLKKLKKLAESPFPAQRTGDTAIGFTLEELLGIPANSSKDPDYKGIELKSGRGNKTRTTLFAQVADWDISPCKKSVEILNKYGYARGDDFKLYCTITTQRENPQGLSFIYDQTKDQLQEWYNKTDLVAVWPGALLRKRLKEKHAETFWVEANSELVNGVEQFQLLKVTHTKSPILSQLLPLIQSGVVTMDHLIKRNGKNNRVSEKGPLFKINKRDLELLFPEPVTYKLV
jgi:hypothetical protein